MTSGRVDGIARGREEQAHERAAWDALCSAHLDRLVELAGLVCGDVASAEDIVQTALEPAWRSRVTRRDGDDSVPGSTASWSGRRRARVAPDAPC